MMRNGAKSEVLELKTDCAKPKGNEVNTRKCAADEKGGIESSFLEPLNLSTASRSFSSPSSPPSDITSFTTAFSQQKWLSSPAPLASRHLPNTSHSAFGHPQTDFVLYDQPAQVSQRPQRAPSVPQPGHTFNTGRHFYANSAPSSTTEFQQPSLRQYPPVPLFSASSSSNSTSQQQTATNMADLNSNNSFDSGASLMPAMQAGSHIYDHAFTGINDYSATAGSVRTVSPQDIFEPLCFDSAPPSTALTNITTPGQSPFFHDMNDTDRYDCSPMFGGEVTVSDDSRNWFPLFTDDDDSKAVDVSAVTSLPLLERTISSQSMERSGSSSTGSPVILDGSFRRKSSVTNSPATNGITKSRRRKGPLLPISVDPSDKAGMKRARNTQAARESRQRKFDYVNELEKRNAELEAELENWKSRAYARGYTES
ncbi:hypothetical protein GQ44DRAFT_824869 [Phaeosphaeriaceae sp. PMI808]|nr:hypothetical protein GQ44DRAFT_824869 [Phaeosphaeriaceae sp. PMI808]